MKKSRLSKEDALEHMRKFCALQERSHQEVRSKLKRFGVFGDALEEVVSALIRDDFLNEERFARSFARGKFRINKWGKLKIRQHLRMKAVSTWSVDKAMQEIDEEEYQAAVESLIRSKMQSLSHKPAMERLSKVTSSIIARGYEKEIVFPMAKALLPENQ